MRRIFLDANVFFAAVASSAGGSYFIIRLAKKGLVETVTVAHALSEAELNIQKKLGEKALFQHHQNLLETKPFVQTLTHIPGILERKLELALPGKDVPIIAGAILARVDLLITLDRKHLLQNKKLLTLNLSFSILTPGEFIKKYFL